MWFWSTRIRFIHPTSAARSLTAPKSAFWKRRGSPARCCAQRRTTVNLGCRGYGRVVEKRPGDQHGIRYDTLVNTVRAEIPGNVTFIPAKAHDISTSNDRQMVTLSNGWQISARLVVLANGLNIGIRHKLGMTRDVLSECHSISIGFDVKPIGRPKFSFPALTHYSESPAARLA